MKQGQSLIHPNSGPHLWKFFLTFSHSQLPYSPVPLSRLYNNKTTSSHMESSSNFCPLKVYCIQGFAVLLTVGIYNDSNFFGPCYEYVCMWEVISHTFPKTGSGFCRKGNRRTYQLYFNVHSKLWLLVKDTGSDGVGGKRRRRLPQPL